MPKYRLVDAQDVAAGRDSRPVLLELKPFDPITVGVCVVQAKRYRGLVPPEAVRALAGWTS